MTEPARFDPFMYENPKVAECTDPAFRVYVSSILWCHWNGTDGRLPGTVASILVGPRHGSIGELVDRGLWEQDGLLDYRIHDYLDWQPSREQVEAERRREVAEREAERRAEAEEQERLASRRARDRARKRRVRTETRGHSADNGADTAPSTSTLSGVEAVIVPETSDGGNGLRSPSDVDRAVIFHALATFQGAIPGAGMTRREARAIGVATSEILRATPDVTVEEIDRRGENYRAWFPGAAATANALVKYWSQCSAAPNGRRQLDPAAALAHRALEDRDGQR